jgi:hypothetical protein
MDNFHALIGVAGWLLSLIFLGKPDFPMFASPFICIPLFGSLGALIAGGSEENASHAIRGMGIGIAIGLPIWAVLSFFFILVPFLE